MSSLAVSKDQQSAFQDFLIDIPAAAPGSRLPFHVLGQPCRICRGPTKTLSGRSGTCTRLAGTFLC